MYVVFQKPHTTNVIFAENDDFAKYLILITGISLKSEDLISLFDKDPNNGIA